MHIVSHRGSSLSSPRHPIHACPFVRCVVVVLFTRLLFLSVLLLFFRLFQMSSSEFHERLKSKDLRDFRLGTVATSDHETPLTSLTLISVTLDFDFPVPLPLPGSLGGCLYQQSAALCPYFPVSTLTFESRVFCCRFAVTFA